MCVYSWEFHLVFTHFSFVNIKNCSHFHSRSQLLVPFHRFYVCVCVWVGAASRRRLLGRPLFCLFVFTPLTFTLYFFVYYFHTDLQSSFPFSSLSSSFSQSINAKHDSRNAIFYLLAAFLFLFCFLELLCFFIFFKCERDWETLMHATKCFLCADVKMIVSCPFHFAFRWKQIKILFCWSNQTASKTFTLIRAELLFSF